MSDETSLVGALNAETLPETPVIPAGQNQPVQTVQAPETGDPDAADPEASVAWSQSPPLSEEEERAATVHRLKALALANSKRQNGPLSTSVAELERLQATHGATALSQISAANAAQN